MLLSVGFLLPSSCTSRLPCASSQVTGVISEPCPIPLLCPVRTWGTAPVLMPWERSGLPPAVLPLPPGGLLFLGRRERTAPPGRAWVCWCLCLPRAEPLHLQLTEMAELWREGNANQQLKYGALLKTARNPVRQSSPVKPRVPTQGGIALPGVPVEAEGWGSSQRRWCKILSFELP